MRSSGLALFATLLVYACGGQTSAENTVCDPGATLTCPPPCAGVSTCSADGSGWSSCCGSAGSGYGGAVAGGAGGASQGGAGSGGISGNGGSAGSVGGVMCGDKYCGDYKLGGYVMPGCCSPEVYNQCGAVIDPEVSNVLSLPEACHDIEQYGTNDPSCPSLSYVDPVDGQKKEYPGCCRGSSCGLKVDFVLELGPYFGCIEAGPGSGQSCGTPSCLECTQFECQETLQVCLSDTTCGAIASCSLGCSDNACVDACVQANPGDPDVFDQLVECTKQNCPIACAALTG